MLRAMKLILACFAVVAVSAGEAHAHAISIGFESAGTPGDVTVWMGTYNHGGSDNLQGSMNLVGVNGNPFPSTTLAFDTLVSGGAANKPSGLIDGLTNFFASGTVNGSGPLVNSNPFTGTSTAQNPSGFNLPVTHWQGKTFSALASGDYQFTYVPIANPSAEWTPWNGNLNGIFTLSGDVTGTTIVPEPTSLTLLGIGVAGLFGYGWRRRKTVPTAG